jgi:hypothetical protein
LLIFSAKKVRKVIYLLAGELSKAGAEAGDKIEQKEMKAYLEEKKSAHWRLILLEAANDLPSFTMFPPYNYHGCSNPFTGNFVFEHLPTNKKATAKRECV